MSEVTPNLFEWVILASHWVQFLPFWGAVSFTAHDEELTLTFFWPRSCKNPSIPLELLWRQNGPMGGGASTPNSY